MFFNNSYGRVYLSWSYKKDVLRKLLFTFFATFFISILSYSQTDSCALRISLLTCAPGEELYSTFGHTAIRVQDMNAGSDIVFNYGTFEFTPDFNTRFIRGKLLYSLSMEGFQDFLYTYEMESRSVREQVLQLNCEEKVRLQQALLENAREENRYYHYDFLFDNCTTRAGDIIAKNANAPVLFKNILEQKIPTFRNMIHSYLDKGGQYWSKLGIDMLLGAKLDRKVTNHESMFLPDYLLRGFDSATVGGHPLVLPPQTILKKPSPLEGNELFTPGLVLSVFMIIFTALSIFRRPWSNAIVKVLDFLFFFVLGLAGLLLLFMWFGTDHKVCANNYNLLWALPSHVVGAFFVHSKKDWVQLYFKVVFWLTIVLASTWFFLPQQMNGALIPVVLIILLRSWLISKKEGYETR
jgi:hypothetical protein